MGSAVSSSIRRVVFFILAALTATSAAAAQDVARHVVLRYLLDGVVHYSNEAPPEGATDVRVVFSCLQFASGDTWLAPCVFCSNTESRPRREHRV
jgi:hypothetical protein